MEKQPNTIYVACISHGKDSNAMLHVIKDILHYPLDRIITTDVWFDDNLRAELPPMVEWKDKADKIILDKWGIPVEHLCAMRGGQRDSYTRTFCRQLTRGKFVGNIKGFPQTTAGWCKKLKYEQIDIQRYILQTEKRTDCEREREREYTGFANKWALYCNSYLKKEPFDLWVRNHQQPLLHRGTQEIQQVFQSAPRTRG